jgi:hypothetical protein
LRPRRHARRGFFLYYYYGKTASQFQTSKRNMRQNPPCRADKKRQQKCDVPLTCACRSAREKCAVWRANVHNRSMARDGNAMNSLQSGFDARYRNLSRESAGDHVCPDNG